jgi:branched-chain amino acid transport system substrate-binding protein
MRALYSYTAVQLWAEAVNRASTAEVQAVALALRALWFDIILRTVGFDAKGEGAGYEPLIWYI